MSATGRTDSASVAASLPNPNSMVLRRWWVFYSRYRLLAASENICPLTLYPPGNSLSAILDGEARLTFLNRGEDYVMNMPYAHCKGRHVLLAHTRPVHKRCWLLRFTSLSFSYQAFCMAPWPWSWGVRLPLPVRKQATALSWSSNWRYRRCWNQNWSICLLPNNHECLFFL